jgi:DNA-binding response OmpR family regulator
MVLILLVDGSQELRGSIKDSLMMAGFVVDDAADGLAALALLERRPFDLLITDLWLSQMDGLALMKHLRAINPKMPVIVLTGETAKRPVCYSVALATTWGADVVVHKPFDNDDLVDEVQRLLAQYAEKMA